VRAILINMALKSGRTIALSGPKHPGAVTVERLTAPSVGATGGVTLGGQRFADGTKTGLLSGAARTIEVRRARNGSYSVWVPPASAAIVTFNRQGVGKALTRLALLDTRAWSQATTGTDA
jgi:Glycosyl hydrolase family 79 C-terminal beta domain